MIARVWRGVVATDKLDDYVKYVQDTGVAEYQRSPGCRATAILTRTLDTAHTTAAARHEDATGAGQAPSATRPRLSPRDDVEAPGAPAPGEIIAWSVWGSEDDIKVFAGPDIDAMVLYPEDEGFLLEAPSLVHYDVPSFTLPADHRTGPEDPQTGAGHDPSSPTYDLPEPPTEPQTVADMSNDEIARAFSGHQFETTFDRIAADATWTLVGQAQLHGHDAIVETCRGTTADLTRVQTNWLEFRSTGGPDTVAVHAVGRYLGPDGTSTVSACDIYEFADGLIIEITSYTIELDQDRDGGSTHER